MTLMIFTERQGSAIHTDISDKSQAAIGLAHRSFRRLTASSWRYAGVTPAVLPSFPEEGADDGAAGCFARHKGDQRDLLSHTTTCRTVERRPLLHETRASGTRFERGDGWRFSAGPAYSLIGGKGPRIGAGECGVPKPRPVGALRHGTVIDGLAPLQHAITRGHLRVERVACAVRYFEWSRSYSR